MASTSSTARDVSERREGLPSLHVSPSMGGPAEATAVVLAAEGPMRRIRGLGGLFAREETVSKKEGQSVSIHAE